MSGRARAHLTTGHRASALALIACAALAWLITVQQFIGMPAGPGTMGLGLVGFLAVWELMMVAMMLPTLAPLTSTYLRTLRALQPSRIRLARTTALVVGYLITWLGFGLLAYFAASLLAVLVAVAPVAATWVGAGLLAAAGIYQLTPLKDFCLRHCRSPMAFLLHVSGYRGRFRDLRVGMYHGSYCAGCCWGLMVVLICVGVMNLVWMAAIAAAILLEKTWKHGRAFSKVVGVGIIVFACFVPLNPVLLPGLTAVMPM
ncbi:hypothetical protein GCM10027052_26790 [Parafrigoribacterium mesophilum]|uniref:DUF2182 domain-containing protein n=1 Tax=Parafrigoribacterium mesophilum TaxID=433646 RepID=UPI0031FD96D5